MAIPWLLLFTLPACHRGDLVHPMPASSRIPSHVVVSQVDKYPWNTYSAVIQPHMPRICRTLVIMTNVWYLFVIVSNPWPTFRSLTNAYKANYYDIIKWHCVVSDTTIAIIWTRSLTTRLNYNGHVEERTLLRFSRGKLILFSYKRRKSDCWLLIERSRVRSPAFS